METERGKTNRGKRQRNKETGTESWKNLKKKLKYLDHVRWPHLIGPD
jgi:hypothetical protein